MKKFELATRLARKRKISKPEAADRLDEVVHGILSKLRRGKSAAIPGLGTFSPGKQIRFRSAPSRAKPAKPAKPGRGGKKK